jgi:hypothetical protein
MSELKKPKMYEPAEGDSAYQLGWKDGAWFQMQVTHGLREAMNPPCAFHVYQLDLFTKKLVGPCKRCGESQTEEAKAS